MSDNLKELRNGRFGLIAVACTRLFSGPSLHFYSNTLPEVEVAFENFMNVKFLVNTVNNIYIFFKKKMFFLTCNFYIYKKIIGDEILIKSI